MTPTPRIVSHEDWLAARLAHLAKEKELTRLRDQLSAERRQLPWERVEQKYVFDGPNGKESLADLFGTKHQLLVYHFMFDPNWETGCKSCSFWADNYNGVTAHLAQRDVSLVVVSRAPMAKLIPFKKRMGWTFKWVSSFDNSFNRDFNVTFTPQELADGVADYNYRKTKFADTEMPGVSVFYKDDDGGIYHTYSSFGRGIDMINGAYHMLDLVPKGRDEDGLPQSMTWVKLHDLYDKE